MRGRLEAVPVHGESGAANLALKALTGLGYTPVEAARMLKQVGDPGGRDVEELVREALSGGVAAS